MTQRDPTVLPLTRGERAAFVAVLALYLLLSLLIFDQVEEDAFIDFRLAKNLAEGYGFVFNRGGERIEASSSVLWMALLLLFWNAPFEIVITAKLLGIAIGCVSLWLVLCLSCRQIANPVLRLGPVLLTVGSVPFLMWSQRGLEAPLVGVLVLWLAVCWTDESKLRWWPVAAILLALTRPEGPLFLLALIPVLGFDRERWRDAMPGLVAVGILITTLLTARFLYFHDFVPSPFYVRLQTASGEGLTQIRKYIVHNHLVLAGIPFVVVAWRRSFWTRERIILGGVIAVVLAWCVIADDYMPHLRNLVPAIPLIFVLACAAADELQRRIEIPRAAMVSYLAVSVITMLFFSRSTGEFTSTTENVVRRYVSAFVAQPRAFVAATAAKIRSPQGVGPLDLMLQRYGTIDSTFQTMVGEFFKRNYPPGTVVVYDQMGQTPFHAGADMKFIDCLGLTDRTVGRFHFESRLVSPSILSVYDRLASAAVLFAFGEERRPLRRAEVLDYVFEQDPDVILINGGVVGLDPEGIPAAVRHDPRLAQRYELRYGLAGFLALHERRDLPRSKPLDVPLGLLVVAE